jgi:hypothetical protein
MKESLIRNSMADPPSLRHAERLTPTLQFYILTRVARFVSIQNTKTGKNVPKRP